MFPNLKKKFSLPFPGKNTIGAALLPVAYWYTALVYLEFVLHIVVFDIPDQRSVFVFGFSFVFACVLALVISFFPAKAGYIATSIVTVVLIILYGSQLVYYFVFGNLYSVSQMQMGGAAVTSFFKETVITMWENLPCLLCLFLPLVIHLLLFHPCDDSRKTNHKWRIILIVLAVLVQILTQYSLQIGGTGYFTSYYFYHNSTVTTDQATERFGLLTAFRLEFQGGSDAAKESQEEDLVSFVPEETSPPETVSSVEETAPVEEVVEYNILNIDFDALNEMTTKDAYLALNEYCATLTGTNKNEYTGMLSDYNLILICAESLATGAIDENITPTLYRLASEGFLFENYYNTFPSVTTDGEYTLCMGLYPDSSRDKENSSFHAAIDNTLPFCLGNVFYQQAGIQSYGYHNFQRSYYSRNETHPAMGYQMKFAGDGMTFTTNWPASDLEMMEQSVDDYISADEQFHAYYMTFSGHYKYDKTVNPMAEKNWDAVKDLDYSDTVKAYLACNIELDKALEYLMQRLEEAGIADRTAIVIAGDHFPYGLTDSLYSELIGYKIDNFTKFKSTLIFWVGGLEENIVVEEYCCNADILPTILNLWGFEYDSRLLAGTDVFSDGTHIAILRDMSFFTDKVWFNTNTGEARYLVDESELPENYLENMIKLVQTKYSFSKKILVTDYYSFVFGNSGLLSE